MTPNPYPIPYDERILEAVRRMHAGSEALPGYDQWIEDHMGGGGF